jgi:Reverse transcriptase (RNA-dependent DNA polymerase)
MDRRPSAPRQDLEKTAENSSLLREVLIQEHIAKCFVKSEHSFSFLPQQRVYAAKHGPNLRRTVKLDPVAEYYIYDVVYCHRARFRKPHQESRTHFGYRFQNGAFLNPSSSYKGFRTAISKYTKKYRYFISFDVASYFNSIYHHDLATWFLNLVGDQDQYERFGQYFREINAGRSVDVLPQGLYASKMIGNDFLRFVDNHHGLKSKQLLRFMDDFYVFSDSESDIRNDFILIQQLLGEKSLNLNPSKTNRVIASHTQIAAGIDAVKKKLLDRRRQEFVIEGYDDDDSQTIQITQKKPLSAAELEYIFDLLARETLEEEDAELILTVMRDHATKAEKKLDYIIQTFPNLMKSVFSFCSRIPDKEFLADLLLKLLRSGELHEYQLFWFGHILEANLMATSKAADLISCIYAHPQATTISKSKILELADNRFGLAELRETFLRTGQSDWLSWSAAVGERGLNPAARNHRLAYFSKASPMNNLIGRIVSQI